MNKRLKPNKTERKERLREIVDKYDLEVEFSAEDAAEINSLTGLHYEAMKRMHCVKYPSQTYHLWADKGGDTGWESFSWIKAIDNLGLDPQRRVQGDIGGALRISVEKETDRFRMSVTPQQCEICAGPPRSSPPTT